VGNPIYKNVVLKTTKDGSTKIKIILSDVEGAVGAARLLFLPMMGLKVSCDSLDPLVRGKTVNYRTDRYVVVVGNGVGRISEFKVPCALDVRRMPPLKRYIQLGLLTNDLRPGPGYGEVELAFRAIIAVHYSLKWCSGDIYSISKCVELPTSQTKESVAILRTLYPGVVEVYRDVAFGKKVGDIGGMIRKEDYWADLFYFIETGHIASRERKESAYHTPKKVRSYVTRYSIPSILNNVDFRDAVVADVGCGYGTKGAYGIRHGARYVVLIDIDEAVLRKRGNGLLIDKLVADAHMLPIREKGVDITISWNVFPFLRDEVKALEELKRVVRREIVLSVYNVASAYRRYSYVDFLDIVLRLGKPKVVRRFAHQQFQAVVRYADKNS